MSNLTEILDSSKARRFSGRNLREIAFPLGGIGTATVSLGGRIRLQRRVLHPGYPSVEPQVIEFPEGLRLAAGESFRVGGQ